MVSGFRFTVRYNFVFPFRFILFLYLQSTKSAKKFTLSAVGARIAGFGVTQVMVSRVHNLADRVTAARAKLPYSPT